MLDSITIFSQKYGNMGEILTAAITKVLLTRGRVVEGPSEEPNSLASGRAAEKANEGPRSRVAEWSKSYLSATKSWRKGVEARLSSGREIDSEGPR